MLNVLGLVEDKPTLANILGVNFTTDFSIDSCEFLRMFWDQSMADQLQRISRAFKCRKIPVFVNIFKINFTISATWPNYEV